MRGDALMKIRSVFAVIAMLGASFLTAGAVSATGAPDLPLVTQAGSPPAANHAISLSARCTPAAAGGSIKVQARVLHAARGKTFSATATAPFTGGASTTNLRRAGRSFVAVGKLPVPVAQATGPVIVSVTIVYNGTATVVPCTSQIHPAGAGASETH
jgi:hypothetical protein